MSQISLAEAQNKAALFSSTFVGFVIDRSASMSPYVNQVQQGVNKLLGDQSKLKGAGHFTLAQFDDEYETVLDTPFKDIGSFQYHYSPRGLTCLYDAIDNMTKHFEAKLKEIGKKVRVIIAVMTDGADTGCSVSLEKIKGLIERKRKEGWEYLFIGTLSDTESTAKTMGIAPDRAAVFNNQNFDKIFEIVSEKIQAVRKGKAPAITAEEKKVLLALPASKRKNEL